MVDPLPPQKKIKQLLQNCIGPTIRIGRESWCLPYAGFLTKCLAKVLRGTFQAGPAYNIVEETLKINHSNLHGFDKGDNGDASNQAVDDEVDAAVEYDEEPGSVVTDDGGQGDVVLKPVHVASLD